MNPITTRHHWTAADKSEAATIAMRSRFGISGISIFLFILSMTCVLGSRSVSNPTLAPYLWISFGVLLVGSILTNLNSLKPFAKRPHAYQVIEWSITPEEISYSCQDQKIKTTWSAFHKIVATPEGLLFLPNPEVFRFIPERAFKTNDDFEAVVTLARQHAKEFKELE